MSGVLVGLENLPEPIIEFVRRHVGARIELPHVYHVTDLCYCLRKAYYKRKFPELYRAYMQKDLRGLFNIFRGHMFDRAWTPLFKTNQKTFVVTRDGVSIVGTLDFVFDGVLYDLKMPVSTYYKKRVGAGQGYRRQVQAYLELAHENGELLNVHTARVLMVAEDCVVDEVKEKLEILAWLFASAFDLDEALENDDPSNLKGPEEPWECNKKYCPFVAKCKGIGEK